MRFSTCRMSTSCSSCSSSFSSRLSTANRSSTACLFSSFSGRCAAMVSARRPASSMPAMDVRISGGIFLLSLTYWSNCCVTARRNASISGLVSASGGTGATSATKCSPLSRMTWVLARWMPSTSTFTVPSGSFSICRMLDTQPTSNMSSGFGSSLPAAFCATSMICRPASIAASSALMDLGRPTKSGITMWGKTTTSRSGSSGSVIRSAGRMGCPDIGFLSFSVPSRARGTDCKKPGPLCGGSRHRTSGACLGLLAVHEQGLRVVFDGVLVEDDLRHAVERGQVEHRVDQRLFHDGPQAACAGLAGKRLARNGREGGRANLQVDAVHREQLLILLHQRVLRFGEDLDQRVLGEFPEGGDDRKAAHQFGNKTEFDEVFGLHFAEHLGHPPLGLGVHGGRGADA